MVRANTVFALPIHPGYEPGQSQGLPLREHASAIVCDSLP